jgi:hypothetical protein
MPASENLHASRHKAARRRIIYSSLIPVALTFASHRWASTSISCYSARGIGPMGHLARGAAARRSSPFMNEKDIEAVLRTLPKKRRAGESRSVPP